MTFWKSKNYNAPQKQARILIEITSQTIVRRRTFVSEFVICENCLLKTPAFSTAAAAILFEMSETGLEQLAGSGLIHFCHSSMLCGASLAAYFKRDIRRLGD